MRNKFRLLALLLMVGLAFVLVACGSDDEDIDPITQFNVLGNFVDGGDGVYTIGTNTASNLSFTYAKSTFAYGYMRSATITQDLSIFKKLVITYEGSGSILVKLETSDATPAKEVFLNVTAIQGSVEWNLIADSAFLAKVDKVVVIASPGKVNSTGNVTITKMEFSVDVAANFIINTGFNNIPENENEYDGEGTTFDFNAKWEDNGDGVYNVSTVGTTTVVQFDKIGFEWPYIVSRVKGDFSDFNYVVAIVSGTAGQRLILKAANQFEASVLLTADQQEVVVDISAMTTEQKNSINQILIFGLAGNPIGTGTFTIHEAFMAETYDYQPPVIIKNVYNGTDATFSFTNWYDNGVGDYEFEVVGTETIITYDKSEAWSYAIAHLEGDFTDFNVVELQITGMSGKGALLKVEGPSGNIELPVTFDGTKQTFVVNISSMSVAARASINKVLIFAAQNVNVGTGTITVHSAMFKVEEGVEPTDPVWKGYGLTVVQTETQVSITYANTPGTWWDNNAQLDIIDFDGTMTELKLTYTGVAGQEYVFKIEGGGQQKEVTVAANGTEQVYILDISSFTEAQRSGFNKLVIFAKTEGASGTLVLKNWEYVMPEMMWVAYGVTLVETPSQVSITYADTPATWWDNNAQLPVPNFDGTKEAIVFTFTGVAGHEYLFKIEGGGQFKEVPMVGDGTEQQVVVPLFTMTEAQRNGLNLIVVFVKTPGASGTVVVKNWAYAEVEPTDPVWMGYGLTVVQTETQVSITYANTPGSWWDNNAQLDIIGFDGTKTELKLTYTGVAGQEYVFKIEGGGQNKEVTVAANGTEQVYILDISSFTEAQRSGFNKLVIFAKTEAASGTLVLKNWEYVMPAPVWTGFGMTVVQNGTDANISYTSTPGAWWDNNARLVVNGFDGTKEGVVFTFVGVTGQEYVFKVEGGGQAREVTVLADGTEQELVITLVTMTEAQRNGLNLFVVFSKTEGASGTIIVKGWAYAEVEPTDPQWAGFGMTVVQTETNVSITYAGTPANWWERNAQLDIIGFDGTKEGITLTFTGVAGQEYVFKIEGGGQNKEVTVLADGTEQVFILDISTFTEAQRSGFNKLVIFSKTEGANGTLVVNNWEYTA